jgi:ubiquinone/menaquinone biosynthesis C-methylase UbiE
MSESVPGQFNEVAEVYDDLMSVVPYGQWVRYVRQLWERHDLKPKRILELACGTGNVLSLLLEQGFDAEGADNSPAMLSVAARKLPKGTGLWCQDARTLALPGPPFDCCLCLFDSLNYLLEPAQLQAAMAAVFRHLNPGGLFIFDMNAVRALETGMFDQRGSGFETGVQFEWKSRWDAATRLCTIDMEFRRQGAAGNRVFHERHVQRGYGLDEVSRCLTEAGFAPPTYYDAYTTKPINGRTDRFFCVARAAEVISQQR